MQPRGHIDKPSGEAFNARGIEPPRTPAALPPTHTPVTAQPLRRDDPMTHEDRTFSTAGETPRSARVLNLYSATRDGVVGEPINRRVLDLSHHNTVASWTDVCAAGVVGIIAKATQGDDYRDETYLDTARDALKAGLMFGAYHFGTGDDVEA